MKSTSTFSKIIDNINALSDHGYSEVVSQVYLRKLMIDAARRLVLLIQTPEEAVRNIAFSVMVPHWQNIRSDADPPYEPAYNACVRIAIDLDLFGIIASSEGMTAADLALRTGVQQELIVRLLRVLCGIGFVTEIGKFFYSPNAITKSMTIPSTAASIIHFFDQGLPSIVSLPKFFRKYGYSSPDDYTNGPYQFGHNTGQESYAYWLTQPDVINNFDTFMNGGKLGNQRRWTDWFPTGEIIVGGFRNEPDAVLLVDVAGGRGHDLDSFRRKHPSAGGRLILEDLPEMIQEIDQLHPRIEQLSHNFFEKQPITGARAYFVQDIFHNWPTSVARLILRNIADAMKPGYSRLLVSELVLPDSNCPLPMAGLDLGMMYLHLGLERSEQQWRDLLASENLEIICIHHAPEGDGAVIEAAIGEQSICYASENVETDFV